MGENINLKTPSGTTLNVLLVGCGKMGGALARRWQELQLCRQLVIVDPVTSASAVPAGFIPQVIVFAIKPQILGDIVKDYQSCAQNGALIVSVVAGKPLSFFATHLGAQSKVVRSMPNTPASIGQGITVACANSNVDTQEKAWASALLSAAGDVLWVDKEALLNPITALSGSGPAYVFLLMEVMTKAGIHIGLDAEMAKKLACKTVTGSAALFDASAGLSAAQLRENVTSPGGTTEAALDILMAKPGLQELFDRAFAAATQRAEELSQ